MTSHIETKRRVKDIADINTFNDIISNVKMSDTDKDILKRIYVDEQNVNFIADMLGYSAITIKRRHNSALKKISKIIKKEQQKK